MIVRLMFWAVIVFHSVSLAASQTTISLVERTLLEREQMAWRYQVEQKIDDYARMIAKDFQGVYENRAGGKTAELVQLKTRPIIGAEVSNMKVVFPNPETAIVTADLKLQTSDQNGNYRSTTFYVKRGTEWMIVYHSHFPARE